MCIICTTKREFVCKCSEAAATAVWIREGLLNCNYSWMCERTCVHNLCHSWPTLGRIPKSVDWSSACLRWDGSAVLRTYVNREWARAGHPCISSEYELDLSCWHLQPGADEPKRELHHCPQVPCNRCSWCNWHKDSERTCRFQVCIFIFQLRI